MTEADSQLRRDIERSIVSRSEAAIRLLAALVRERSLLGHEEGAQRIVEHELRRLGFEVEHVEPNARELADDPASGYPPLPYDGRSCVVGRIRGLSDSRSLHLSGHADVVPVEDPGDWSHDPWAGDVSDGRVWGRGAGDMKGGLVALLLAVEGLISVCGPPQGDLIVSSVIEEENTGNGMRAVLNRGYDADATLIAEPSGLEVWHAGVGVVWARLTVHQRADHALSAPRQSSIERLFEAVARLRGLETVLNTEITDEVFANLGDRPYKLNLGQIQGGIWPASVPTRVTLRVRLGFGRDLEPADAQQLIRAAIEPHVEGIEIQFEGHRAPAYYHDLDNPFARLLERTHTDFHQRPPRRSVLTGTTDARHVAGPCVCYGPIAGEIHGTDEWVDIDSVVSAATSIAVVASRWFRAGKLPGTD